MLKFGNVVVSCKSSGAYTGFGGLPAWFTLAFLVFSVEWVVVCSFVLADVAVSTQALLCIYNLPARSCECTQVSIACSGSELREWAIGIHETILSVARIVALIQCFEPKPF